MGETRAVPGSWADGDRYEAYIGRWSRPVAHRFARALAVPPGRRRVDVGCGTGVLTRAVLDLADPASVHGVHRSAAFVRHATAGVVDRVSFGTADAAELPQADASVGAVVAGLALNFLPDAAAALAG